MARRAGAAGLASVAACPVAALTLPLYIIVPTFYSILRPRVATALLSPEMAEMVRVQKQREQELGLHDE